MISYKNGGTPKAGDFVRGRGSNVAGVVEGYVLQVNVGAEKKNIVVGTIAAQLDADVIKGTLKSSKFVSLHAIVAGEANLFETATPTSLVPDSATASGHVPPPNRGNAPMFGAKAGGRTPPPNRAAAPAPKSAPARRG